MTDLVPRFAETAARLVENGYEPLPIHYGQKRPCAGEQWQRYRFKPADADRFAEAGTGLLCGKVIGLDIDVRDAALVAQLEALAEENFGRAPRRIGQAPKVLRLYQADKPFNKIATRGYRLPTDGPEDKPHRVEILAQGQQFVAYNIHPDTGKPYVWNGAGEPLSVGIGFLPSVSESQARAFISQVDVILARHGQPVGRLVDRDDQRQHEPNEEQRAADHTVLRDALRAIPNDDLEFDEWIRIVYATKGALGQEGLPDLLQWSARAQKDVPSFTTQQFTNAKPATLGAGTIYFLATQHGWKRPRSEPAWPAPVNLFAELAAPEFDAAGLPELLAAYPTLYAAATGFDPSIALTAAISAAAAALSDDFRICADRGTQWFQSARLWLLTIAPPGAGKTPAQRELTHPLRDIHSQLSQEYERTLAEWERRAKKAADEAEAGSRPPRPRVIVSDTTIEALADVLRENPRGIYIVAEEFDSWLGSLDQYRGGEVGRDRGQWLSAFDGGPNTIERVKRGAMFVPNWGVSILTATTPAGLARLTKHLPIDGLLQRFIPVIAHRQRQPTEKPDRGQLEAERARYTETLRRLWAARPRAHSGVVSLSQEAQQLFQTWLRENELLQEALGSIEPALEAHIAKYPSFALRLALTYHAAQIVNRSHEEARDPACTPVSLATLQLVTAFLRRASQHALALYLNGKGKSVAYELAQAIARFVLARTSEDNARGLTRRDLIQRVRAFRDADERLQATALGLVSDLGWLRVADGGYQKAAPTRYAVNPTVADVFAVEAQRERQRRDLARERITEAVQERREQNC